MGLLSPPSETRQVPNLVKEKEIDYYTYILLQKGLTSKDCTQSVKVKHGLDSSELDMWKAAQREKCVHGIEVKKSKEEYSENTARYQTALCL